MRLARRRGLADDGGWASRMLFSAPSPKNSLKAQLSIWYARLSVVRELFGEGAE